MLVKRNGRWMLAADNGAGAGGGGSEGPGPDDKKGLSGQGSPSAPSAGDGDAGQRAADAPPASWDEVFQHERFKGLLKRAKEAEAALEKQAKDRESAEAAKLAEQQRFEELYQKEQAKAQKLADDLRQAQLTALNDRKRRAVQDAARTHEPAFSKEALADVMVFVDLESLEVGEDGAVKGVEAAVKALAKEKPYMLEQKRTDPGSPAGRKTAGAPQPQQRPGRPLTL